MAYFFKNLVFEGGGVKGIAYVGALEVLREQQIFSNIKRVSGTSAGAIIAVMVGLGYTPDEIKKIMWDLDFKKFKDGSWGFVRNARRILNEFGLYKGEFFREWMGDIIKEKMGTSEATFADVAAKKESHPFLDIYLIGTNLSTGYSEMFSAENTPNVCIADAARISMSIPLFFASVRGANKNVYVDGGMLNNYSIKAFDSKKYVSQNYRETEYYEKANLNIEKATRKISGYVYNKETLGFRLDSEEEIALFEGDLQPPARDINDFFDYVMASLKTLIDSQNNAHLHSDDWQRTIYINTLGVSATDFNITEEKKKELLESGRTHTLKYLDWYNNEEEKANK